MGRKKGIKGGGRKVGWKGKEKVEKEEWVKGTGKLRIGGLEGEGRKGRGMGRKRKERGSGGRDRRRKEMGGM